MFNRDRVAFTELPTDKTPKNRLYFEDIISAVLLQRQEKKQATTVEDDGLPF